MTVIPIHSDAERTLLQFVRGQPLVSRLALIDRAKDAGIRRRPDQFVDDLEAAGMIEGTRITPRDPVAYTITDRGDAWLRILGTGGPAR